MPELDRLYYTLGIKTDELEKGIKKAENSFNELLSTVTNIAASIGVAFGFKSIIQDIQNLTMNFDSAMRQVWTLTDMTAEEFNKLQESVIELSKQGPYSAEELARALYQTISAGVDASHSLSFLAQAMKAAQAGATDLFTAVDGLTTIMNAWGLSMEELAKVSDAIFVAVREGKTTFQELAMTIGTVAPTASQAGISLEEILSAVAALTKQGIDTARAMTSLNYAIQSVIAPTEEAKKTAKELGIEFNSSALASKGLVQFLEDIYTAAQGNQETLSKLFGSVEALRGVFALTGNAADDFVEILNEMANSAGETEKAAGKMGESLRDQFQQLKNQLNAVKMEIGLAFKPTLELIAKLGEKFATWVENMSPAEKAIMGISTALVALIPTITILVSVLNAMSGNWVSILFGLSAAAATLTVVSGTLRTSLEDTKNASDQVVESFESLNTVGLDETISKVENINNSLKDTFKQTDSTIDAHKQLNQLISDYNYAVETGLGDQKQIKKQIDEIIKAHPELAGAVEFVNSKYEINFNIVKEILNARLLTLEQQKEELKLAKEELKVKQEKLKATILEHERKLQDYQLEKQYVESLQENYTDIIERYNEAKQQYNEEFKTGFVSTETVENLHKASQELRKLLDWYNNLTGEQLTLEDLIFGPENQEKIEKFTQVMNNLIPSRLNSLDAAIQKVNTNISSMNDEFNDVTETIQNTEKELSLTEKQITTLQEKINNLKLTPATPNYEEKLKQLDAEIKKQEQKLKELEAIDNKTDQQLEEFETTASLYVRLLRQKRSILEQALATNIEKGIFDEKNLKSLVEQINEIDKTLESFGVSEPTTYDFSKTIEDISKNITGLENAINQENEEVAETIYRQAKSTIQSAIARAYIEGNQEAVEELQQKSDLLNAKYQILLERQHKALEETLDKLEKTIEEATKAGEAKDTKTFEEKVKEIYAIFDAIDTSKLRKFDDLWERFNKLSDSIDNLGVKVKSLKNANVVQEILQEIMAIFGEGGEVDTSKLDELLEKIFSLDTTGLSATELETLNQLVALIKELSSTSKQLDQLKTLESYFGDVKDYERQKEIIQQIIRLIEQEKEKAILGEHTLYGEGKDALPRINEELEMYKNKLQEIEHSEIKDEIKQFEEQLKNTNLTAEEQIDILNKLIDLYSQLGDTEKIKELQKEIDKLSAALKATTTQEKYQILIDFYMEKGDLEKAKQYLEQLKNYYQQELENVLTGGMSAFTKTQLENLIQQTDKELQEITQKQQQELLERELQEEYRQNIAKKNVKRYSGYIEMYQIQQLRKIAQDETRSYKERIEALEKILDLQNKIGESAELLASTEREISRIKEQQQTALQMQRNELKAQVDFLNAIIDSFSKIFSQFGEIGEMINTVLSSVEFSIEEIKEDGETIGYKLVNPFEDLDQLTKDIQLNLANWAIQEIADTINSIVQDLRAANAYIDKMSEKSETSTASLIQNFKDFEKTLAEKQKLEIGQAAARAGLTTTGALIGGALGGPLGALIGAGIGAAIGNGIASSLDEEIAKLDEKLQATWQKVKEAFGTDIDSIASALEKAFSASTYEDFVSNFSQSLEEMTKQALIKAFLASKYMQPLFDTLSDTITSAVMDGILTAEEIQAIKEAGQDVIDTAKPFFETLQELFDSQSQEWGTASAVRNTITEETGNRLAALLSTINLNVAQIKDKIVNDIVKVEVINIQNIGGVLPQEFIKTIGG